MGRGRRPEERGRACFSGGGEWQEVQAGLGAGPPYLIPHIHGVPEPRGGMDSGWQEARQPTWDGSTPGAAALAPPCLCPAAPSAWKASRSPGHPPRASALPPGRLPVLLQAEQTHVSCVEPWALV